jgi:hypothetical protein
MTLLQTGQGSQKEIFVLISKQFYIYGHDLKRGALFVLPDMLL